MSVFRLIEGLIQIARPCAPIGYATFDGVFGPSTDLLFDLGAIRKDIYIENNATISVKLNTVSSPVFSLGAGIWTFEDEFADKIYITTTIATDIKIYANG